MYRNCYTQHIETCNQCLAQTPWDIVIVFKLVFLLQNTGLKWFVVTPATFVTCLEENNSVSVICNNMQKRFWDRYKLILCLALHLIDLLHNPAGRGQVVCWSILVRCEFMIGPQPQNINQPHKAPLIHIYTLQRVTRVPFLVCSPFYC